MFNIENFNTVNKVNDKLNEVADQQRGAVQSLEKIKMQLEKNADDLTVEEVEEKKEMIEDYKKSMDEYELLTKMLKEKREELKKSLDFIPSTNNYAKMNKSSDDNTLASSERYLNAYAKMLKGDAREFEKMQKSLSTTATDGTTADAFGGVIPTYVESEIQRRIESYGNIFAWIGKSTIKGLLKMTVEISATPAEVHTEGTAEPTEESITLKSLLTEPAMIKKWISWTDEIESLSGVDLVDYLIKEFTVKIIQQVEKGIVYGNKDANGKGLVGITEAQTITDGFTTVVDSEGVLTYQDLLSAVGQLKGNNGKFFMEKQTFYSNIMGMTDTTGQPVFRVLNDNAGRPQNMILGIPVEFNDAFPSYDSAGATDYPILLLDFEAYKGNFPNGTTIEYVYDPYSLATEDKKRMVGKLYAGGRMKNLEGASIIQKGTEPTGA